MEAAAWLVSQQHIHSSMDLFRSWNLYAWIHILPSFSFSFHPDSRPIVDVVKPPLKPKGQRKAWWRLSSFIASFRPRAQVCNACDALAWWPLGRQMMKMSFPCWAPSSVAGVNLVSMLAAFLRGHTALLTWTKTPINDQLRLSSDRLPHVASQLNEANQRWRLIMLRASGDSFSRRTGFKRLSMGPASYPSAALRL